MALSLAGKRVGLLDIDIHGPSVPTMLGLEDIMTSGSEGGLLPPELEGMKVMSIGFLLPSRNDAVIWRGPMKHNAIKQFLKDVIWGDLDYLIVDSPPGTGDEPLAVCQLIDGLDGALIVTTPQRVSEVDVRKSITFCHQLRVPVLGVVENMSGFICPKCGEITHILPSGGGKRLAAGSRVPFLGAIPMDPAIAEACDSGHVFIQHYSTTATAQLMQHIIEPLLAMDLRKDVEKTAAVESTGGHRPPR
jgi:Mrp family chromosome partitioning ATPase